MSCVCLCMDDTVAVAVGGAAFGPGTGRILMQSAQCNGSETNLLQCRYSTPGFFSFRCSFHDNDASVVCQGKCATVELPLNNGHIDWDKAFLIL